MEKYKKNPLSLQPGGHTITFVYRNGKSTKHDHIKYVNAYKKKMESVIGSSVIDIIYANRPMMPSGHNLQASIGRVNREPDVKVDVKFINDFDLDISKLTKLKEDRMQFHQW